MKAGVGAKRNVSLEQGVQVSMATQRVATTTKHCHTKKLGEDTCQPPYSPRPTKRREVVRENCHTKQDLQLKRTAQPPRASMLHLKLCKNWHVK